MRKVWVEREIDAPAPVLWSLLTDLARWPDWGPSVRGATIDGDRMELGAVGRVVTVGGFELGFEITEFEHGERWSWKVAGREATDHRVALVGSDRCRVGFGVPWFALPYALVCREALRRLDRLAASADVAEAAPSS